MADEKTIHIQALQGRIARMQKQLDRYQSKAATQSNELARLHADNAGLRRQLSEAKRDLRLMREAQR